MADYKKIKWKEMKVGSFFFGIGGFDQAAKEMGWTTDLICEWKEFGQLIAKEHYKEATIYGDIRTTDFSKWRGKIDILCGGFPCQPFSTAGLQLGTEDERHLWPEMRRGIREIQPCWVVGENVFGLVSWNGGLVFEQVQADLEAEGYEVIPFILPAAGVNAPHRRNRVWFIAHRTDTGIKGLQSGWQDCFHGFEVIANANCHGQELTKEFSKINNKRFSEGLVEGHEFNSLHGSRTTANTNIQGLPIATCGKFGIVPEDAGESKRGEYCGTPSASASWQNFPTQPPVCTGNDGFSTELLRQRIREDSLGYLSEKEIDKILSKAYTKWREETIKAAGNAIVPQVALQIFKAIEQYELTHPSI